MKILISSDGPHAFYYVRLGLARAFHACGHEVRIWDINSEPAYDVFDFFEPDLFLGQTYNTTDAICNIIKERPHMKVIMKGSDWGPLSDSIPSEKYPILKVREDEKKRILDLYNEVQKPDFLHIHYHPDYIEQTHGSWIKEGIPAYSMLLGADVFEYGKGSFKQEFKSDITFIGGYWGYKSQTFNKWLIPLCNDFKYQIKIFGNSPWPVPQYCGYVQNELTRDIFASATICPNLSEPHSQDFGFDIIERPFKLLANKCFVISDYVEGLKKLFPYSIVSARDPKEFVYYIEHFLKNPDKRFEHIQSGYNDVMNNHTYFHRVKDIFSKLGLNSQAKHCENTYKNYDNSNNR